jgi:hypothetical protein
MRHKVKIPGILGADQILFPASFFATPGSFLGVLVLVVVSIVFFMIIKVVFRNIMVGFFDGRVFFRVLCAGVLICNAGGWWGVSGFFGMCCRRRFEGNYGGRKIRSWNFNLILSIG